MIALPRRHWPGLAVMSHISKLFSQALNRQADCRRTRQTDTKLHQEERERERDGGLSPRRNVGRTTPAPLRLSLPQHSLQHQVVTHHDGDPRHFRALKVPTLPTWRRTRGAGLAVPSLSRLETRSCATLICRVQVGAGPLRVLHTEPLHSFHFFPI